MNEEEFLQNLKNLKKSMTKEEMLSEWCDSRKSTKNNGTIIRVSSVYEEYTSPWNLYDNPKFERTLKGYRINNCPTTIFDSVDAVLMWLNLNYPCGLSGLELDMNDAEASKFIEAWKTANEYFLNDKSNI